MAVSLYKALYDLVESLAPVAKDIEASEVPDAKPEGIEFARAYKQAVETLEWESGDARR